MNPKMNKLAVALLASLPAVALAEDGWTGKGEFGLVMASGNTETQTVNAALELAYTRNKWTQGLKGNVLRAEDGDRETANRYTLSSKTQYALSKVSYTFLALRYEDDQLSGYDNQMSFAVGYGRKLLDTDTQKLSVELGAGGAQFTENTAIAEEKSYPIARGSLSYSWQITDNTQFTEDLLVEGGSDNTLMENKLGLSVAINKKLALKLGYEVKYNTEVPDGVDDTDTLFTTNLVYNLTP